MRDYSGLDAALDRLAGDVYPDVPTQPHKGLTESVVKHLGTLGVLRPKMNVLDVGTGCGLGLNALTAFGCLVTPIDLKPQKPGVLCVDQSFLPFVDDCYDLVWARHVLEHSIMPLYTLMEWRRVLKTGGHAYVEVPAPDTDAHHESNANHYSVLGINAWGSLMLRLFAIVGSWEYQFAVPQDKGRSLNDKYFAFLLKKETPS